ncbi:MutS family DNA mismatch repair protein [Fibrella forsythiae]|uniref:DNA mismatch repair protein MutS n=1 Tax=Fibrella forsythiae TaxID=2817061 RepID=A0ABS3JE35_9BACT|nr:MutS family DNA mismatch repair protein [Fibrella forsythiae]MBO0948265.1 DNA mismatch repair protein MutS [Fibrella forsythiae]
MTSFSDRQRDFQQKADADQQRHNQLAIWRLVWFSVSVATIWQLLANKQTFWALLASLIGLVVFARIMTWHRAVRRQRDLNRNLVDINLDEQQRLNRTFSRPETGVAYAPADHAYAHDLDVFGKHSLFRLLNRTRTHDGAARLAQYLLQPALHHTIFLRQQAVDALKPHINWRQDIEATAMLNEKISLPTEGLRTWATGTTPLPTWLNLARFVLPVLTLGVFISWVMGYVPGWSVFAAIGLHGVVLNPVQATTKQASEQTHDIAKALADFADLFRFVESLPGEALLLTNLRKRLQSGSVMASTAVGHLARLVENFNFRRNPYFYLFIGLPSLWDAHYLFALNRWRAQHGPALADWFSALAETEALNSLAGFAYAHPDYAQPDLLDEHNVHIDAQQVAHPLIPPARAIANSLAFDGSGKTILITGSNMSGKSTFLRTVGLNVVLAQAGAVVAARRFVCSPVQVYTSMRTQDSLEENTSSFYAELKRLRTLIQHTQNVPSLPADSAPTVNLPILYFLDEILKGTNSADRHKGAEALIRQLHRTKASGFVSTHDLELGQLGESVDFVQNYHFRSDIHEGEVTFDYTLRPGVCQSFNASQLMKAIGIDL